MSFGATVRYELYRSTITLKLCEWCCALPGGKMFPERAKNNFQNFTEKNAKISIFTKFSMLQKNRLESKNKIWVRNRHKKVKCLLVKSHSQKLLLFFKKIVKNRMKNSKSRKRLKILLSWCVKEKGELRF